MQRKKAKKFNYIFFSSCHSFLCIFTKVYRQTFLIIAQSLAYITAVSTERSNKISKVNKAIYDNFDG